MAVTPNYSFPYPVNSDPANVPGDIGALASAVDATLTSVQTTPLDASVSTAKIIDGAVTSGKIADGTIVDADISASAAITKTKIAGTAITAADTGTVTATLLATDSVTTAKILDGNVTNAKLANSSVTINGTAVSLGGSATIVTGIPATLLDAKGDLIVASANDTAARLAVGADNTFLVADSSAATGLAWKSSIVATPTITAPTSGATNLGPTVAFTATAFVSVADTHASSDWQVASDSGFATIVSSTTNDTVNLTSWTSGDLAANTTFYARVRYKGTSGNYSSWSAAVSFTTKSVYAFRINGISWYEAGASSPDSYYSLAANGTDGSALSGNTGYTRQGTGTAVVPYAQAMMRRCVLKNDGTSVLYYLDCDDSTKIAGTWSGSVQTGWLRVHEGYNDPVKPLPGQGTTGNAGLRAAASAWSSSATYSRGDLVTHNSRVWVSLSDANSNITPASGSSTATLDGSVGQVMVEVPRFYVYYNYTSGTKRHAWDVLVDPAEVKPFPNLSVALSGAVTTKTDNELTFTVHPAFQKAGVERSHRYYAAYRATDNGGTLTSRSGVTATASQTRATFRTQARARNTGLSDPSGAANNVYGLLDWYLLSAVKLLFLTEYRTFNSQDVLGRGVSGTTYTKTAGRANQNGNASGSFNSSGVLVTPSSASTTDDGVLYRGIEDFWGPAYCFIDGYNAQGTGSAQTVYLANTPANFADDTASNYTNAGTLAGASGGYPTGISQDSLFIANNTTGGSTSTYLTDIQYTSATNAAWRIVCVGGYASLGLDAGAFCVYAYDGSAASGTALGGALCR